MCITLIQQAQGDCIIQIAIMREWYRVYIILSISDVSSCWQAWRRSLRDQKCFLIKCITVGATYTERGLIPVSLSISAVWVLFLFIYPCNDIFLYYFIIIFLILATVPLLMWLKHKCAAVEGRGRETERAPEPKLLAASCSDNLQAFQKQMGWVTCSPFLKL